MVINIENVILSSLSRVTLLMQKVEVSMTNCFAREIENILLLQPPFQSKRPSSCNGSKPKHPSHINSSAFEHYTFIPHFTIISSSVRPKLSDWQTDRQSHKVPNARKQKAENFGFHVTKTTNSIKLTNKVKFRGTIKNFNILLYKNVVLCLGSPSLDRELYG